MRLIDADALIDYLQMMPIDLGYREVEEIKGYARSMPTMDAVPVAHAHWIYVELGTPTRWSYRCSNCSRLSGYPSEYCPFCGVNMNEEVSG